MRLLVLALLFVSALAAQRGMGGYGGRGGFGGRGGVGGHGGFRGPGGIGYGAAGHRPGFSGGIGIRAPGYGHAWAGRGVHSGFRYRGTIGAYNPIYSSGWLWGGSYFPWGWYSAPLWGTPAAYGVPEYYPYSAAPNVTVVMVPAPNYSYAEPAPDPAPVTRAPVQPQPPTEERPLTTESWAYLIAAKNGTIWLARDYSVVDGVLHFSTTGTNRKELRLADVDRELTEQLNREQGVAVRLP
jgi:hypothetical protein